MTWVLLIHGGAGTASTPERARRQRLGLEEALDHGTAALAAGGSALDAVELAVRALEACGSFNAGAGAVRDRDGGISMDAAVMSGPDRRVGAIAAVRPLRSPVAVARLVMERSPHVLLAGAGAEAFAAANGHPLLPACARPDEEPSAHDTVGAVALDLAGRLAAATSTGGMSGKLPGRVGDSPVIGAGTWADQELAVSATGHGEYFIRTAFAHQVVALVRTGRTLADATAAALAEVRALGGDGGCIAVDRHGATTLPFITAAMPRGFASPARRWTAIAPEG
jgi:isoaspartyl peptidase/L-asparaginase-like protein (Ntn-hydrolase superfamily)